ncbi:hypothetical protein SAMN02990966_01989 [Rhodospirillales bacterium URHD0017]|nr:hypothetical protein SAMN02990966_01989 [Rhodospirillales bacterium URHD0017]
MKPTSSPIDVTNQKVGVVGLSALAMWRRKCITVGIIPAISSFIDSSSDRNVPLRAPR